MVFAETGQPQQQTNQGNFSRGSVGIAHGQELQHRHLHDRRPPKNQTIIGGSE